MHAAEAGQGGLQPALDRPFAAVHVVSLPRSAFPGPGMKATIRPQASVNAWIFVAGPPRERPTD